MSDQILFNDYNTGATIGRRKSSFRINVGDMVHIDGVAYIARSLLFDAGDSGSWRETQITCHVHLERR